MSIFLENSKYLQEKNINRKNLNGIQLRGYYVYELHMKRCTEDNGFGDSPENTSFFTLETLREVISIMEKRLKRGVRSPVIFFSPQYIRMADNLTVSLTEYMIYYYYIVEKVEVYITQGYMSRNEFRTCTLPQERFCANGFLCSDSAQGFMLTSFLLEWHPKKGTTVAYEDLTDRFFLKGMEERRFKAIVGRGPWDASVSISKCQSFLQNQGMTMDGIEVIMDVVGELVPNAIEHGETNCLLDVSCEEAEFMINEQVVRGMTVSIVVLDFSENLLWTALKEKIFVDADEQGYINKIDRINAVKRAWSNHKNKFNYDYGEYDFYNVMAFQKISGRKGDRIDGGLGISTLIKRVQRYTKNDYCYILSGNGALRLDSKYTASDEKGYIGFNTKRDFVDQIPDHDAVMKTHFYMPGVAYNLCFNFMEDKKNGK